MYVASGKAQLAVDAAGDHGGPPALLLHAGVADRRSWRPLAEHLAPRRRSFAVDRRGFGATRYEPEPFSTIGDSLAVLDAAGATTAAVIGSSIGGRAALDLALAHPDRLAALVLIAPAVRGAPELVPDPPSVVALAGAIDAAEAAGDLAEVNRLEAHLWLDGPDAPERRVGGMVRELFLDMNGIALAATEPGPQVDEVVEGDGEGGGEAPTTWDRLGEIDLPTLVLAGEYDLPESIALADALAERMPRCTVHHLAGTAHLPHLEGNFEFLQAVADFLDLHQLA